MEVIFIAIPTIPLLPEDYPLFDWGEHPDSDLAASIGGLVSDFKKETWNDLVDRLEAALTAAGLSWSSDYTTAQDARVTQSGGILTARAFNSLRHNIDLPAPIGWAWADDPRFRGYLGRKDFRGVSDAGDDADYLYASYMRELVRKLNLLLEILRDTAPFADAAAAFKALSDPSQTVLGAPLSAPLPGDFLSLSNLGTGLTGALAAPVQAAFLSRYGRLAQLHPAYARRLAAAYLSRCQDPAGLVSILARPMFHARVSRDDIRAAMATPFARAVEAGVLSHGMELALPVCRPPKALRSDFAARSVPGVTPTIPGAKRLGIGFSGESRARTHLLPGRPCPVGVDFAAASKTKAGPALPPASPLESLVPAGSKAVPSLEALILARLHTEAMAGSGSLAVLFTQILTRLLASGTGFSRSGAGLGLPSPEKLTGSAAGVSAGSGTLRTMEMAPCHFRQLLRSRQISAMLPRQLYGLQPEKELLRTVHTGSMGVRSNIGMVPEKALLYSCHTASGAVSRSQALGGWRSLHRSSHSARGDCVAVCPMRLEKETVLSQGRGTVARVPPLGIRGSGTERSAHAGTMDALRQTLLTAVHPTQSAPAGRLGLITYLALSGQGSAQSLGTAWVDSIWWPPVLEDGVLLIRSSYENAQRDTTLLFDTADTPWESPVLEDGVLTVTQARMAVGSEILEVK